MKKWHVLATLLLALSLSACAKPASRMAALEPGMSKQEVVDALGKPSSVSYDKDTETLYYAAVDWPFNVVAERYRVVLVDGRVVSYGKDEASDW